MEAEVFEQQRLAFLELERHFFGFGPNALWAETDIFAARQFLVEQHAQTLGDGLETQLGIGLAFGTAEVRREDKAGAVTQSVLDAGQGFADARVVHDAAVVERDVEVDAHEDAANLIIANCGAALRGADECVRPYVGLEALGRHQVDQIADTAGVAPLVVIPRDHFDAVAADYQGHMRVDDGGAGVSFEIG